MRISQKKRPAEAALADIRIQASGVLTCSCSLVAPDSPGGVTHPTDPYAPYRNGVAERGVKPIPRPGATTLPPPPQSVPVEWQYVYVHAKLMIIDDVFMTLGSANINTRSMEVDSELNICHERPEITQPLRRRLWGLHTAGQGAAG